MFVLGKHFHTRLMFESKAATYPSLAPFRFLGRFPAFPSNIRPDCSGLPKTNTLAYLDHCKLRRTYFNIMRNGKQMYNQQTCSSFIKFIFMKVFSCIWLWHLIEWSIMLSEFSHIIEGATEKGYKSPIPVS